MAGQNIARLASAVNGMDEGAVEVARGEWRRGEGVLDEVTQVLDQSGRDIKDAFGGKSKIGPAAQAVLDEVRGHLDRRRQRMGEAQTALDEVAAVITRAKNTATTMPDSAPGEAPRMEGGPYVDDAAEIQAMKQFAAKNRAYTQQVNAYNEADERARVRVEDVNDVFQRAGDIFSTMWEPDVKPPETGGDDPGTTGGRGPTRGAGLNPHEVGDTHDDTNHDTDTDTDDDDTDHDTDTDDGGDTDNDHGDDGTDNDHGDDHGDDQGDDGGSHDDGDDHGGDLPADPFEGGLHGHGSHGIPLDPHLGGVGGGAAAVLGGAGLRGLFGGGVSATPAVPGQPTTRPIGSTTRSGAGGVLGRNGAAAGQPGGRPGTGAAGGRGAGRRGAPGAGRGGRRRKDEERDDQRAGYDVDGEWTDDEGQYPGVIQ